MALFFFAAVPFSQTSSLLTWALKRGLCLALSFKPLVVYEAGRIVLGAIGSGLSCVSRLEMKVPCCSIRGISSTIPSRRKRNLARQSWQCLSLLCELNDLFQWILPKLQISICFSQRTTIMLTKYTSSFCLTLN